MRGQSPDLWLSGTAGVLWPGDRRRSGRRDAVRHAGVAVDRASERPSYPSEQHHRHEAIEAEAKRRGLID